MSAASWLSVEEALEWAIVRYHDGQSDRVVDGRGRARPKAVRDAAHTGFGVVFD